ncbi:Kiwa anti-phage protein KwaB-like domain-containing protein [Spirosoma montaniterrae]|uniref:DUF4868 domain-containing protein n=1 Tax=Spirosoma montaniterrae TaxID=1178516 RepID=A0A1P9WYQ5_9BACT|nr:Kiwa anti-phage protein KwaB-like domain-containing protein [Spirosoma montaniterrae]AQG80512.1 hypothetical protein AWR27_14985 [Spirosoma montaniterrae]
MTVDQPSNLKQKLNGLKRINFDNLSTQLVVVKAVNRNRQFRYTLRYVPIEDKLSQRLHNLMQRKVESANICTEYTLDCLEPEVDMVLGMERSETDFSIIAEQLSELDPNVDIIQDVKELEQSSSYLIVMRDTEGIQLIGFKVLPENWKAKGRKNLISLLFKGNEFIDLDESPVFSISKTIDVVSFEDTLFILSKKEFERGLNYREGMKNSAQEFYNDVDVQKLFVNLDSLTNKVGDNIRLMRKVAHVKKLGYYKDPAFILRLCEVCTNRDWHEISFVNSQIVLSEDNIEAVLTILADQRLLSELTSNIYDVNSAKRFNNNR